MLKKCLTVTLISAALGGALAHSSDYVTASGVPLKSGFGECVRTGYWAPGSEPCEPAVTQLAMHEVPRMPAAQSPGIRASSVIPRPRSSIASSRRKLKSRISNRRVSPAAIT